MNNYVSQKKGWRLGKKRWQHTFFRNLTFLCSGSVPTKRGGGEETGVQAEKGGRLPGGGVMSAAP